MLKPGTHSSPSNHNTFEDVDQLDKFAIEINQEVQEHRLRYLFSSFLFIAAFDLEVVIKFVTTFYHLKHQDDPNIY